MRQAFSGQYGYGPFTPHAGAAAVESDRLANIKRAVESIEQRLHGANLQPQAHAPYAQTGFPAQGPVPGQALPMGGDAASQLSILQQQLARLSSQVALVGPAAQLPLTDAQDIARRQAELNAAAQRAEAQTESQTPIQAVNKPNAANPRTDSNAALGAVARHLKDLRKDLNSLKQEVAKPAPPAKVEQPDIDRIATALANLQAQKPEAAAHPETDRKLDGLAAELNALRATLEQDLTAAKHNDSAGRDLEMHQRLDALSNGLDTLAQHAAATMTPQVENLGNRLDDLRTSVEDMPQTLAISRLEDRMGDLAVKLEDLAARPQSAQAPDVDIAGLEGRLDEIARALVAVSNINRKAPKLDMTAIERLEARMSDLGRAVDSMASASVKAMEEANANASAFVEANNRPMPEVEALSVRIEGLVERLGSFEKYAASGDLGAANEMFAAPEVGQIEEQLRTISARLDQQTAPDMSALEQQVQTLSQQMQEASAVNSTAAQMSNLEAQIGQILRQMDKQPSFDGLDFGPVETRLGAIEEQLHAQSASMGQMPLELAQQAAEQAAQQAAQQAVSMMGSSPEQSQILAALSEDLKSLQQSAVAPAQAATNNDAVNSTLHAVLDRLASLEGAVENTVDRASQAVEERVASLLNERPLATSTAPSALMGQNVPSHTDQNMGAYALDEAVFAADGLSDAASTNENLGVIHQAALDSGFVAPPTGPVVAPPLDPSATMDASMAGVPTGAPGHMPQPHMMVPENNAPLEPGSPAPQIDDYLQQATQSLNASAAGTPQGAPQSAPSAPGMTDDGVETDFTAAARKAAAYAREDGGDAKGGKKGKAKKGAGASGDIKSRIMALVAKARSGESRRPIIMAAAAVLLTALVWNGWSMLTSSPDNTPVAASVEQSVEGGTDTAQLADEGRAVRSVDGDGADGSDGTDGSSVDLALNNAAAMDGSDTPPASYDAPTTNANASNQVNTDGSPVSGDQGTVENASTSDNPTLDTSNAQDAAGTPSAAPVPTQTVYDVPASAGPAALIAAASAGDQKALFQLGMRYSEGDGVTRNMGEAASWFERSAKTGFAPAQYSLGSLYEKGIGVERDIAKAADWYDKAAAQGNARAMHNLA
ncbi:MAG: hypothetical protein AAF890_02215, partial [Pseudomonadota bacterium]